MGAALRTLCRQRTELTERDIALLETYETTLPVVADLIRGDAFIDCMDNGGCAFVVAQASPQYAGSKYQAQILGMAALPEDEPAVYRSFLDGMPFHDIIANTQENKTVSQAVSPIKNDAGSVIGVLIVEQDVSRMVRMENKLQALADDWQQGPPPVRNALPNDERLWVREAHHRIKNNLQLIASICSIKARRAREVETQIQLEECAGMVMSVAKLHEMLSETYDGGQAIQLDAYLKRLTDGLSEVVRQEKPITFSITCDAMEIDGDTAVSIALVISELILNAVEHAFGTGGGHIFIQATRGNRFGTVVVTDDGAGFPPHTAQGAGLHIVSATVQDKLGGEFTMTSDANGAKAAFTFALHPCAQGA